MFTESGEKSRKQANQDAEWQQVEHDVRRKRGLVCRAKRAWLIKAGISHLTFACKAFRAQVPDWVPLQKDDTVVYSGLAEITLGSTLVLTDEEHQEAVGKIAAAFFAAVFPGNISQYVHRRSAFGLDTDTKRFVRLFFQPALIYWALKSTQRSRKQK